MRPFCRLSLRPRQIVVDAESEQLSGPVGDDVEHIIQSLLVHKRHRRTVRTASPALSAGKGTFDVRLKEGVWLTICMLSYVSIVGACEEVAKVQGFFKKPESGGRWSKEYFDKCVRVPWEPCPGAGGVSELRSELLDADQARRVQETSKRKGSLRAKEASHQEGRRGEVRLRDVLPGVQSSE